MYKCTGKLLSVSFVTAVVFQHDVIAERTICVVLPLALGIRTAVPFIQLNVSLSFGHLPDLDSMLVALVCETLDFPIIEILDPQNIQSGVIIFLVDNIDLLKSLLVTNELLVKLLIIANIRTVFWWLDVQFTASRLK
jgi:hypothetical protein